MAHGNVGSCESPERLIGGAVGDYHWYDYPKTSMLVFHSNLPLSIFTGNLHVQSTLDRHAADYDSRLPSDLFPNALAI